MDLQALKNVQTSKAIGVAPNFHDNDGNQALRVLRHPTITIMLSIRILVDWVRNTDTIIFSNWKVLGIEEQVPQYTIYAPLGMGQKMRKKDWSHSVNYATVHLNRRRSGIKPVNIVVLWKKSCRRI